MIMNQFYLIYEVSKFNKTQRAIIKLTEEIGTIPTLNNNLRTKENVKRTTEKSLLRIKENKWPKIEEKVCF